MADLDVYKVDLTTPVPPVAGQPQRYGDAPKVAFSKYNDALDAIEADKANTSDLGTAATKDVGESAGQVMEVGAFGLGRTVLETVSSLELNGKGLLSVRLDGADPLNPSSAGVSVVHAAVNSSFGGGILFDNLPNPNAYIYSLRQGEYGGPFKLVHAGNILGTVSQSAGVPTGAIIERGSNANGEFVRFADGTQIVTVITSTEQTGFVEKALPIAFIDSNYLALGGTATSSSIQPLFAKTSSFSPSTYSVALIQTGATDYAPAFVPVSIRILFVGRWF